MSIPVPKVHKLNVRSPSKNRPFLSNAKQIRRQIPIIANVKQRLFQLLEKPNGSKLTKKEERMAFSVENFNKINRFTPSVLNVFNKRADEFLNITYEKTHQFAQNSPVSVDWNATGLLFLLR